MPTEPRNLDDPWQPGQVARMTCPWRYCRGVVNVLRHAPSSDRLGETVDTVEQHHIVGPNSWYQVWCPGSHLIMPLSPRGREVLDDADRRFERAHEDRSTKAVVTTDDLTEANREIEDRKRKGTLGHLDGDPRTYFPPRPSDVEEAEDAYAGGVPTDVDGTKLTGRGSMSSNNDTTIGLLGLAKNSIGNGQEDGASGVNLVELVDAKLKSFQEHLTNAAQILAAAAMGSASNPRLVDEAATMIAAAGHHLDEAMSRLAGVNTKMHDAHQAALHAVEKIDEFIGQISR